MEAAGCSYDVQHGRLAVFELEDSRVGRGRLRGQHGPRRGVRSPRAAKVTARRYRADDPKPSLTEKRRARHHWGVNGGYGNLPDGHAAHEASLWRERSQVQPSAITA